jgi:hypothetical protein
MSSNIKIFKLNYSGTFKEISAEKILLSFTLFDIITFYVPNQRLMYIWIGKKVSQSLKKLIPQIRGAISNEYPELKILRNITIESGLEPAEFLDIIGITEEVLKVRIKKLETNLLPILSEINRLKEKVDKYFISENYIMAIDAAQKIVNLAKDIDDDSLEQDQINFINEAQSRAQASEILHQIEHVSKEIIKKFNQLVEVENYREAHNLAQDFKKKYENEYDISSIPLAQQLILKDENMIYSLKIEQAKIKKEIDEFYNSFKTGPNKGNLKQAKEFFGKIKAEIKNIFDDDVLNSLKQFESQYNEAKKETVSEIAQVSMEALNNLEKGEISKAIEIFEKIITKLEFNNKTLTGA